MMRSLTSRIDDFSEGRADDHADRQVDDIAFRTANCLNSDMNDMVRPGSPERWRAEYSSLLLEVTPAILDDAAEDRAVRTAPLESRVDLSRPGIAGMLEATVDQRHATNFAERGFA